MPAKSSQALLQGIAAKEPRAIGRAISIVENNGEQVAEILAGLDRKRIEEVLVLGITGPPGAGKSTLTSCLIRQLRGEGKRVGIIAIDPSSPISGGAILGDRVRMMDHALDPDVVVRSMATRGRLGGICASAGAVVRILAASGCEVILIETVGVGQSEMDIVRLADITLMVLAPGFGDDIQAMKAGLLEVADFLVVNKSDLAGAEALVMDMQQIFAAKEEESGISRVLQSVAAEEKGIRELLDAIESLAAYLTETDLRAARRQKAMAEETMDWIFELLRPVLAAKLAAATAHDQTDPRVRAKEMIKQLLHSEIQ